MRDLRACQSGEEPVLVTRYGMFLKITRLSSAQVAIKLSGAASHYVFSLFSLIF